VPKEKREFLTYSAAGLCPCTLELLEDGVALHFEADGLVPATEIREKTLAEKLRFLINAAELECLYSDYTFSLAPANIMTDINLCSHVLARDLNCNGEGFLPKYKALIGQILAPKYKYSDYLNGGDDLYKKNKLLAEISEFSAVAEIKNRLTTEYEAVNRQVSANKKLVSKRSAFTAKILIPVLAVALVVISFFAYRANFVEIPFADAVIEASHAYIAGDFIAAQAALRDIDPADMSHETRHFLARAYVITEALTDAQKDNILMGLTRMTDTYIFHYWIHLGRLNFDEAHEIAGRFGDTELMLFAYLKQEAFVRADVTMSGDARVAELARLERRINQLQSERNVDVTPPTPPTTDVDDTNDVNDVNDNYTNDEYPSYNGTEGDE
jgi:type VII secretion protein EssB